MMSTPTRMKTQPARRPMAGVPVVRSIARRKVGELWFYVLAPGRGCTALGLKLGGTIGALVGI